MTISNLKSHFFTELKGIHEESEIDSFFLILIDYLHQLKRIDLSLRLDFEVSAEDLVKWESVILELKKEKPIQYITGEAWFYGLRFEVNEHTLIPRPETEELVEWIIESRKLNNESRNWNILDIGTGSGCIPIALKHEIPTATVYTMDVSEKAIEIAKKNALDNEVQVNFIHRDILKSSNLQIK